jgi:hypothetical protein
MGRYSVRVNDATKLLEIEMSKKPMAYPAAAKLAAKDASSDSRRFRSRAPFRPSGTALAGNGG